MEQKRSAIKSFEIEKIKDNDIEFYEHLFKQYYQPLIYFAYRYVQDEQIAEDIIHDVFVHIWNNRQNLDFSTNFKSYLYHAARNRSFKYLDKKTNEKKHRDLEIVLEQDENTPETIMINKQLGESISSAINELPEKRREIFCMHRFDQLTYSEIASALDISVKTVETQMSRALKSLRDRLSSLLTFIIL